jgi:hypothetical protein
MATLTTVVNVKDRERIEEMVTRIEDLRNHMSMAFGIAYSKDVALFQDELERLGYTGMRVNINFDPVTVNVTFDPEEPPEGAQ